MRRRKKYGYILLATLIISGLAGTPTNNSLTGKERKFVAEQLKSTKVAIFLAVKDLTQEQINFRPGNGKWTINECINHIILEEKNLWALKDRAMQSIINPERRIDIKMTDEEVINLIQNDTNKTKICNIIVPENSTYDSFNDALDDLKNIRTENIKYIKATTEDLRSHIIQTPISWIDCYQVCLLISAHSYYHIKQIHEIKANPKFPK